ncbi:MAG: hypothetical protein IPF72_19725 [Chitinophagaceae bacterium]|nr:hypothetical protein [Chitinophagaceae bacterium]
MQNSETKENNLSVKDTILSKSDKSFSLSTFHDLLDNLNKTKDNFEKANLLPFLSPISKKEILSVAKKHHNEFWLIDGENGRVDKVGRERIKKIKRLYLLDTFLLMRKPSLEYEMVVLDAWNNLTISFCEQTDTTKYSFQFYELLGQPFSKTINNDYSHRVRFVNSDVNGLLTKFFHVTLLLQKPLGFRETERRIHCVVYRQQNLGQITAGNIGFGVIGGRTLLTSSSVTWQQLFQAGRFQFSFCCYLQHEFFNWALVTGGRFSNPSTTPSPARWL